MTAVEKTTDVDRIMNGISKDIVEYIRKLFRDNIYNIEYNKYRIEVDLDRIDINELKKVRTIHEYVMKKFNEVRNKIDWQRYNNLIQFAIVIYEYNFKIELRYSIGSDSYGLDAEEIVIHEHYNMEALWEWILNNENKMLKKKEINFINKIIDKDLYNFSNEFNKAYKKMEELLNKYIDERVISDWEDESFDMEEIILTVEWKNNGINIQYVDVVEILKRLENVVNDALATFEDTYIEEIKSFINKFKTLKEVEEYVNKKKFKKYADLLDKAKDIMIVYTRQVYNKTYRTNIDAFKILLLVDNEDKRCDVVDLARLMKLDNVKFEYLAKNNTDFVVSIIGSDRVYDLLYTIAMKVYDGQEALKKASEWQMKIRIFDR